ncbi:MAG: hypothetical protein HOP17_17305 [Acidobacteria bacterium]|nr:hypothetical protein [Acidobacteriota bacterium]
MSKTWDDNTFPMAYLVTFRTYGTWLHGDKRGSVSRHQNRFRSPRLPENSVMEHQHASKLKSPPVRLDAKDRRVVENAIREVCKHRGWHIHAINVRTNHVHVVVVVGAIGPDGVLRDFKAYTTRALRNAGYWKHEHSPWVDGGSNRYLWNEESVWYACDYVLNGQGDDLPNF